MLAQVAVATSIMASVRIKLPIHQLPNYQITRLPNHHLSWVLRVVFEKRLLLSKLLRLDVAILVRRARNNRVLAWRRARPREREHLPRELAGRRHNRRGLPRPVVDLHLD